MDKEQIKKIIDGLPEYDESEEDTIRSWIRDFYSDRMSWVMINFYVVCFVLLFPIIISIIKFFRTDQAISPSARNESWGRGSTWQG